MTALTLKNHPFFKELKLDHLDIISRYTDIETFKPGEYVFKEGDTAQKFYVIATGRISVEISVPDSYPFTIQNLQSGDVLGWSWFIEPNLWRFSGRALEKSELIVIDGKTLKEACEKDHELGYEIFKRLAKVFVQRLEATRQQLMEFYSHR